ncbi:MAG: hypothetical protein PHY93_14320 [Bacteriovorax sp.]|nr:hypothetical protein [Bacteriovorax sp.]
MKKFQHLLNSLVLLMAVTLTSCGYLSDKPPANLDIYRADALQACKIDIDKLGEIFKADQKEQIRCLQENFIQFTKYVRSRDSGSVSESDLNAFIRKFFLGQSDSIVKGLSLIFQLNMLLLKDEADRISKTNISPLFDLLVKVNQEAIIITQVLKEMDDEKNQGRFWDLRAQFTASVNRFSVFTVKIIEKSPGLQQKLNIKNFLIEASKKLGNKEINPDTIDSLIFLKRVLVAGDKEVITSDELSEIIAKLPKILTLSFDLYFVKNTNFSSDADHARFYLENVRDIYSIIQFNQNDFDLFSIDQILRLAQEFMKDVDIKKFKPSILAIKSRMIGGSKETFSLRDLKNILDIGHDYIERTYFNTVTYNIYHGALEKNEAINYLQRLELPNQYDLFSARRIDELHNDFQDIAMNIHYFRSKSEGVSYYGNKYVRNKFGYLEASIIKWASIKLLKGYGHKNAQGVQQVSLEEFQTFLFDMKPILEEFKLWSPNPETFARNAVLLADLFQNKSNGDLEINVNEATEYIQMILTAVNITDKFKDDLTAVCDGGINNEDPVFDTACYNEHFFETLLSRYQKFFPRLADYVDPQNTDKKNLDDYLIGVEGFARDVADPKIPVNKRDNVLIIGAMLNIETTFIRFDTNKDNIIDYKELVEAFKLYKSAIIIMAKLKPNEESYAQSIFLYMVSKMEIPPTGSWAQNGKFLAFHTCAGIDLCRNTFMDKIEGKRLNIGKLLYYMVNQNSIAPNKGKKPL